MRETAPCQGGPDYMHSLPEPCFTGKEPGTQRAAGRGWKWGAVQSCLPKATVLAPNQHTKVLPQVLQKHLALYGPDSKYV